MVWLFFYYPQYENEQKRRQTETESENDEEDEEEYCVSAVEPCNDVTRSKSLQLSKSDVSIGERLAAAVELNKPELCAPRVVMETPLTDEKEECEVTMAEEFPDLTTVDTADSFIRLKELGARICPESTLGWVIMIKGCIYTKPTLNRKRFRFNRSISIY